MNEYSGFSQHTPKIAIELAQSGDRKAMHDIYIMYASPCFCLAKRLLGDQTAAQDVVHSIFVKVMNNITSFSHSGSFAGWLRQISVNESIAYIKGNSQFVENREYESHSSGDEQNGLLKSRYGIRWWETCKDLEKLTQRLSGDARAVLFLHELEGYSHKDIAALFGKSESFSKQTLYRAFKQLRAMNAVKELNNAS
jgi:RNA polymerase sigma factor (sigma-70 family)